MKIDIVIPTAARRDKLTGAISSIEENNLDDCHIYIYASNLDEVKEYRHTYCERPYISTLIFAHYEAPKFWNSHLNSMNSDIMVYLNDDVTLFPDCLDVIRQKFETLYPDFDGMLGLNQVNIPSPTNCLAAFGAIGKTFADRFQNRKVFCPDYHRFYDDRELWLFADKIKKFTYCEDAKINHYHPSFYPKLEDETHERVRGWLHKDRATFAKRQAKGLLWGENFTLLYKERYV